MLTDVMMTTTPKNNTSGGSDRVFVELARAGKHGRCMRPNSQLEGEFRRLSFFLSVFSFLITAAAKASAVDG